MRRSVLLVLGALTLVGCGSPFSSAEQTTLAAARARWAARPFADYSFEFEAGCFCPPEETGPVHIEVRAGTITAITRVADGAAVPSNQFSSPCRPTTSAGWS